MTTQQNANTNPVIAAKAAIQKLRRSRASHPEPTNTPVIPAKAGTHGPDQGASHPQSAGAPPPSFPRRREPTARTPSQITTT